jgi:beta-glucosidase
MLAPGEKKKVTFHLPVDQLAFFDLDLNLVIEAGLIEVMVGSSSADIRLSGEFSITADKQLPIMERVFFCPVEVS